MGIEPIGVFSASDAGAFHLSAMARAMPLGAGSARETYLNAAALIGAAREAEADAVHPGYGFLSENAAFARAVAEAGLLWIGPSPESIEAMGDKLQARRRMRAAGVPVVPGSDGGESSGAASSGPVMSDEELLRRADEIGYPVLVKASAGGGGKGMARVERREDLSGALSETRRIAGAAFADASVYLEKLFERPRHVEFQVFGDRMGSVVHLFERECSVQRRHQKVLEETPSPVLDARLREAMGRAAMDAARAVSYVGAGTVEFLVDERRNFYFLEMNTRLQVEHPITEETLGLDLVRAQIEVAAGASLPASWRAGKLLPQGHAIELRLYAEDPVEFLPRTGRVLAWELPDGPGIRVDAGVGLGSVVGVEYDPLLAKLVVSAPDRDAAIARARRALEEWVVLGVETNAPLLASILEAADFQSGRYATDLIATLPPAADEPPPDEVWSAAARALQAEANTEKEAGRSAARRSAPGAGASGSEAPDPWSEPSGWRAGS